ncbi:unnamed protein product, partial [Nesidiocoris tenuis]
MSVKYGSTVSYQTINGFPTNLLLLRYSTNLLTVCHVSLGNWDQEVYGDHEKAHHRTGTPHYSEHRSTTSSNTKNT